MWLVLPSSHIINGLKSQEISLILTQKFFYLCVGAFNGFDSSDDDESDEDDDDDDDGFLSSRIYPNRGKISDSKRSGKYCILSFL